MPKKLINAIMSQKCAAKQELNRSAMIMQLRCLRFLAQRDVALRRKSHRDEVFWQLMLYRKVE